MRRSLLTLLLCLPFSLSAQTLKVVSVQISGSNRLAPDKVAEASGIEVGQSINLEELQSATNRLAQLGLFTFVNYRYETTGDTVAITFMVEESARLRPCEFDNFVWIPHDQLLVRLQEEIPLFTGESPPGGYVPEEIKRVLETVLMEHGVQARAVHLPTFAEEGGVNLFRIEGVSIPVVSVQFQGVEKLGKKGLQQAAQSLLSKNYSRLFLLGFVNHTLLPLYRSRGYLQARFTDVAPHYLGEAEGTHPVRLVFQVKEGEVYRVRKIEWTGNQILSSKELEKHIRLGPGDKANTVRLDEDLRDIVHEEYGRRGYIQARLPYTYDVDDESRTAVFTIRAEEGDPYRFHSLLIEGLPAKISSRLEKQWKLKPGDPYDATYLSSFLKDDVPPLVKHLRPHPRDIGYSTDLDESDKSVTVVLSFR